MKILSVLLLLCCVYFVVSGVVTTAYGLPLTWIQLTDMFLAGLAIGGLFCYWKNRA